MKPRSVERWPSTWRQKVGIAAINALDTERMALASDSDGFLSHSRLHETGIGV
jgi:hypothetical protein